MRAAEKAVFLFILYLTSNVEFTIMIIGGKYMADVRKVFVTKEVADMLNLSNSYTIKLAKKIGLSESEMREAGIRNYLFNESAVEKLKKAKGGTNEKN
jgi:hypothetical protein